MASGVPDVFINGDFHVANGIELMINALLKASGISMEQLRQQAEQAFGLFKKYEADSAYIRKSVDELKFAVQGAEVRIIAAINKDVEWPDRELWSDELIAASKQIDFTGVVFANNATPLQLERKSDGGG